MKRAVVLLVLGLMTWVALGCREKQPDSVSHSDILGAPALDKTADQLRDTDFTVYLDHPIFQGKNLIWCATMPLTWNELLDLAGGEIHIAEGDPPWVTELNKRTVTKADLDDSSYVALGGLTPGILDSIPKALAAKFQGQASPELLGQIPNLPLNSAVAYSYLFKDLEFEHPFQELDHGLYFQQTLRDTVLRDEEDPRSERVFGFGSGRSTAQAKVAGQVRIHDYRNSNDFVIEIATRSRSDRLLLAKIHPLSTLAETIKSVRTRADSSQGKTPENATRMEVPILDFRLVKDYKELLEKHVKCPNQILNGFPIVMARQLIQFKLNEEGARLKSEAVVAVKSSDMADPGYEPPQLIFNKPYLVLMERKGAANPYFALWIDNPELLVPFVEEKQKQ